MQPEQEFRYSIKDSLDRYYTAEKGSVSFLTTPVALKYTPDGWMSKSIKWERNLIKHGIFTEMTQKLRFPGDGASILRYFFDRYGYEAKLQLIISRLEFDTDVNDYIYKLYFKGDFDFLTFVDNDEFIEINILEGGLNQQLKAYQDTPYDITIEEDAKAVLMDGLVFKGNASYKNVRTTIINPDSVILPVDLTGSEVTLKTLFTIGSQKLQEDLNFLTDLPTSVNCMFQTNEEVTVTIQGIYRFKLVSKVGDAKYRMDFRLKNGASGPTTEIYNTLLPPAGTIVEVPINKTYNLVPVDGDQRLFLTGFLYSDFGGVSATIEVLDSEFTISFNKRFDQTVVFGYTPQQMFNKLLTKITGITNTTISQLLSSLDDKIIITSGDALRRFPKPVIRTTFNQFIKFLSSIKDAGLGIFNKQVLLEYITVFYQNTEITNVGPVRDCKRQVINDLIGNLIKIGYEDQSNEETGGRDEFNTTAIWSTPVTRVQKELNYISPYNAGMYIIELTRINFEGKKTTDSKNDKNTFILSVTPKNGFENVSIQWYGAPDYKFVLNNFAANAASFEQGEVFKIKGSNDPLTFDIFYTILSSTVAGSNLELVVEERPDSLLAGFNASIEFPYDLRRENYDSITGIIDPGSAFNVELSPKRSAEEHYRYWRSIFFKLDNYSLTFQTLDKNKELRTELNGKVVDEDSNIRIVDMGEKIFDPILFTFFAEVPVNILELMNTNPYGYITFNWKGKDFKGFVVEINVQPHTNEAKEFKLLALPNQDYSVFNNYE